MERAVAWMSSDSNNWKKAMRDIESWRKQWAKLMDKQEKGT